jgi:hypothetical protein
VLKDLFNRSGHLNFLFETNKKELFKELEAKPYLIYSYYGDIEQEIDCYIKYCPICKETNYFSQIIIESD